MKSRFYSIALVGMLGAGVLASASYAAPQASKQIAATNFADPAFKSVWTRTDSLVSSGAVKRSYFWGPIAGTTLYERYDEGPNGVHLVQYFDKSRMEINNPNGNKNDPFYVTNGLLATEMISGRMQVGNDAFVTSSPADIDIASDTDDTSPGTPTYASFHPLIGYSATGGTTAKDTTGKLVTDTIDRGGTTGTDNKYAIYKVHDAHYELGTFHNIPDIFWQFLNQSGPVVVNGKTVNARLSDPYFYATGYPITEAYWASVTIAGVANTPVLVQPFERRVLTYVPTAPAGFKVQMGNIGQHYYQWRYNSVGVGPNPTPGFVTPVPTAVQCNTVPVRGFGIVWATDPSVRGHLECSLGPQVSLTVAHQYFQHGEMIDIINPFNSYSTQATKIIYVLFDDGAAQRFEDTQKEGDPEPNITPPPGLYTPIRGFGKVWREGTGANVRGRLGWAIAPETVALGPSPAPPPYVPTTIPDVRTPTAVPIPPGQSGAFQQFSRGFMVSAGPAVQKVYVLFNITGYDPLTPQRWEVFDDTYTEP